MKNFYKLYFCVGLLTAIGWMLKFSNGTGDFSSFFGGAAVALWLNDMIDIWRIE